MKLHFSVSRFNKEVDADLTLGLIFHYTEKVGVHSGLFCKSLSLSTIFRLCICLYLSLQENKTQESSKCKKKMHEKAVK